MQTTLSRGTINAVLIENKAMVELYSVPDQNRIQREGLRQALSAHRSKNIAKRFSREVRQAPLRYQWSPGGRPLVSWGTMAETVYTGNITTSTRGGTLSGTLTLPPGHPLPTGSGRGWPRGAKPSPYRNEIQRVLGSMTPAEAQELVERLARTMIGLFQASEVKKRRPPGGGERGRRLTTTQRARIKSAGAK